MKKLVSLALALSLILSTFTYTNSVDKNNILPSTREQVCGV